MPLRVGEKEKKRVESKRRRVEARRGRKMKTMHITRMITSRVIVLLMSVAKNVL